MSQTTDALLATAANVIGNETVAGANTADRVRDLLIDFIESKINNDKIEIDPALVTALKTVAGRDAVKGYIDNAISAEVLARNNAISVETSARNTAITTAINNLVNGAPGALDTLEELAAALGDDQNFATTVTNTLALKASTAYVDTALLNKLPAYNVMSYGAKHDYQTASDASVTSGSPNLTTAGNRFTAADTGKTIRVYGAGAAGIDLITTITYVSATAVTLGVNASTTVAAKKIEWGTDDTPLIQSAINACYNAGGGVVYFPNGIYFIAGALVTSLDGVNPNCQIYFPLSNASTPLFKSVKLLGESLPNPLLSGLGFTGVTHVMSGVVLKSVIVGTGTLPSVLGSSFVDTVVDYNLLGGAVENISIQVKSKVGTTHVEPIMTAFNFRVLTWVEPKNNAAFTESDPFSESVEPTVTCYGFYMPQTSEAQAYASSHGQNSAIGFNVGFRVLEHENLGKLFAVTCRFGFEFARTVTGTDNNHPIAGLVITHWCKYAVMFSGATGLNVFFYNERSSNAAKWYFPTADFYVPSTVKISGKIDYHIMTEGGTHNTLSTLGVWTGNLVLNDIFNGVTSQTTNTGTSEQTYVNVNSASAGATSRYDQNNRAAFLSYSGSLYGGSGASGLSLFGQTYADKYFLFSGGANNLGMLIGTVGSSAPLFFGTNNTERARFISSGQFGLGVIAPTARLHIAAGTATANTAPLKLTSGTNLTTAEAGAFEYNGTNLFFTRAGTTRENIVCASAVNTVAATAPDRTLTVNINGTTYYIHCKTTND